MFEDFGINAGYVEGLHALYLQSPQAVEPSWRAFFEKLEQPQAQANGTAAGAATNGAAPATPADTHTENVLAAGLMRGRVYQLLNAYRVRGHLFANLDPLGNPPEAVPELELKNFGLSEAHLDAVFPSVGIAGLPDRATLRQIISHLSETYCKSIGVEFNQIEEPEMRTWLQDKMEATRNRAKLDRADVLRILTKLTDAEIFEQFIHKNYVGAKRFSLEGAESLIAMLDLLVEEAGAQGVQEIVIGMAHRGRLNVLANTMGKNVREIFAQFEDKHARRFLGRGDVKYHLGYSSDRITASGAKVHLSLAFNPSHLEFVNPVVEGRVRAKQVRGKRIGVMPLLIHGDAAFMGQGVVPETLNLAGLEGYSTGGTVHLIVNNQIGFTTNPEDSRSTRYASDITRMLKVPVFHVNGEDPEAVIQVTKLAIDYRQKFGKDVVIDMYCYRRYGHNEGDEPRFTQPVMYSLIDRKPTVREVYVNRLVGSQRLTREEADAIAVERRAALERALDETRHGDYEQGPNAMEGVWAPYYGGPDRMSPEVPTGVAREVLLELIDKLTSLPEAFHANPKARRILEQRRERLVKQGTLQWETAEHLAFATLLREGHSVRLSGQDARRGTFSHRHAVLYDTQTGEPYTPLAHLFDGAPRSAGVDVAARSAGVDGAPRSAGIDGGPRSVGLDVAQRSARGEGVASARADSARSSARGERRGRFEAWDSPLSEAGVLGFDYGYSLDTPDALVIWEGQFGDFANSGQVIIDQFIVSAEDKWLRLSGIVLLLPHGYEGAGPEHSSARLERWLQMAAEDNMQVCNPTTPAQFFHLLRRQVLRPWRKPLAVMTPKSLLRAPYAVSKLDDLVSGRFQRVIPDTADPSQVDPRGVKRILICSGKVYYDLEKARSERKRWDVAIVRLEQYYPLNEELNEVLGIYAPGTPLVWVQEEPRNMGASYYMNANLPQHTRDRFPVRFVCRPESASPATGSHASHDLEQKILVDEAFAD